MSVQCIQSKSHFLPFFPTLLRDVTTLDLHQPIKYRYFPSSRQSTNHSLPFYQIALHLAVTKVALNIPFFNLLLLNNVIVSTARTRQMAWY